MKKADKIKQSGQAALVSILLIMGVLLILFAAVGLLTVNVLRSVNNVVNSAQSYYVAEAGVEDALLRIANKMSYTNSYTLSHGLPGDTDVVVSGPTDALVVTSSGNVSNRFRKVSVNLNAVTTTTNISFNYGVQVGYGGLEMGNNAGVNGNVYSNGPIISGNGGYITGTAVAATGVGAIDQDNSSPASPPSTISFGNANSSQDGAQSFQVSSTNQLNSAQLYLRKTTSSNPGNITVRVTNNSSGNPGTTTYATGTIAASSVGTSYGWVSTTFDSNPQLTAGITYWLVLDTSTNSTRYYNWGANNTYSSGQAKTGPYSGGPWNTTGLDGYFRLSLGGIQNSIENVDIGSAGVGDAWAHEVNDSTIDGTNYCQLGSGNDKACNTSRGDPPAQNLPISDSNVNDWKAQAAEGGTITGDYVLTNGATASLGPKVITGNLDLSNNVTLTMTGTIYVMGTVTFSNGVILKLDSGYGANGGVLIADGYINMGNLTTILGSGQSSSYFLMLSTNDCDGLTAISPSGLACTINNSAIEVSNNVGSVIVYTTRGLVDVSNNAGAKEVTGYKVKLQNNAVISYSTGLTNAIFSSGPGGGYTIDSWVEIE